MTSKKFKGHGRPEGELDRRERLLNRYKKHETGTVEGSRWVI